MSENKIVYLRLKKKISANPRSKITLSHIAHITANFPIEPKMKQIPIYQLSKEDKEFVVIDSYHLIELLNELYPDTEFQLVGGANETIISIIHRKKTNSVLFVSFVWITLFIGTAMTIINFHYDVSMLEVHQRIHFLFTGEQVENPLWIQIPYSFGLGIGMILFLNHWFKKKLNEEPSPLEVELFKYKKSIDEYVAYYENELNDGKRRF